MIFKNYTTDYLQSLLNTVGKNSEYFQSINKELELRNIDYEWIDNQIYNIQTIGRSYRIADNVKAFMNHYGLDEETFIQISDVSICSIIDKDKAKVLVLVDRIDQWNRQYTFGRFTKEETYSNIHELVKEYLSYKSNVKKDLQELLDKQDSHDKNKVVTEIMRHYNAPRETAEEIYKVAAQCDKEITEIRNDKILSPSQVKALVDDITYNCREIVHKKIDNHSTEIAIKEWLNSLKYGTMDEFYATFLSLNDVHLDKCEQQDVKLNQLLRSKMLHYHTNLLSLQNSYISKPSNLKTILDVFLQQNKKIYQDVHKTLQQYKESQKEKQQQAKKLLLDLMHVDDDSDAKAMLEHLRNKMHVNTSKQEQPSEKVKENPLDAVKEALADCYSKLDGIETIMDGCHEHLQNLECDTFSLTNIILTLMDNGYDHTKEVLSDKMDIQTYLKQYKTIQLSVGRFRGIVEAISNLAGAEDVIIVPENHHKQQYAHLSSVIITPNELHLIPDAADIGYVYVDYYKTIFDSEMKSIYEKLGKSCNQFFIMLG